MAKPKGIASVEQLDATLAELGRIAAEEARLQSKCDLALAQVRAEYKQKMCVLIEGEPIGFAERTAQLTEQCRAYCDEHRELLLADGLKSRKLTHGEIGWKQQRISLAPAEGGDEKHWLERITGPVLDKLLPALAKIASTIKAAAFLDLKLSWNKGRVLDHAKTKQITTAELRKIGFVLVGGDDVFYLRAAETTVENHATAA